PAVDPVLLGSVLLDTLLVGALLVIWRRSRRHAAPGASSNEAGAKLLAAAPLPGALVASDGRLRHLAPPLGLGAQVLSGLSAAFVPEGAVAPAVRGALGGAPVAVELASADGRRRYQVTGGPLDGGAVLWFAEVGEARVVEAARAAGS